VIDSKQDHFITKESIRYKKTIRIIIICFTLDIHKELLNKLIFLDSLNEILRGEEIKKPNSKIGFLFLSNEMYCLVF
jgi:hypothetical protein